MLPMYHSYGCSGTFFHCRYIMSKNVPIAPPVDQIFTHKLRGTAFETNGKRKDSWSNF